MDIISTFTKIIPGWSVNMNLISNPILQNIRKLAMARVLNLYGGMFIPSSFICFKNLENFYQIGIKKTGMFVCDVDKKNYEFMGCLKNNNHMESYIHFLEECNANSYTQENEFLQRENTFLKDNNTPIIDGELIGTKSCKGDYIGIDNIMSNNPLKLHKETFGLYIPSHDLLKRIKYQWFNRLSPSQILNSNTQIASHLLFSQNK